ncbi:MAG: trans-aconitate 2-methyltransferase [Dehalococcoidia bacterium]
MSQDAWDPAQYARFRAERRQPFYDLLALVQPVARGRVVDLGCGTGELTVELHRHTKAAATLGIDHSPAMLESAARLARPGIAFAQDDIASFTPDAPVDIVFSNAALQWVPDHESLFTRLATFLVEGGQLAVQMPANHDHASHVIADATAQEEPFRSAAGGEPRSWPVLAPEAYATLLDRLGFRSPLVRLQVYVHHLGSREDVVEWVKGTYLTYYRARFGDALYEAYLHRYRERLMDALPDERPYVYTYKRLLLWARR